MARPQWMHWFRDYSGHQHEGTPQVGKRLVYMALDSGQNDKLIVFVAALGFFVDSYILFATNVINPILGYVYWHDKMRPTHEFAITTATLCGCIFGQLLFGWLGDQFGRRKVYGWELLVLMIGTTGVIMSSTGYVPPYTNSTNDEAAPNWGTLGSMDVYKWLLWWRFVTGTGIGGDYPLSSVLVSEFAPTQRRSWMLSLVFSMQALGYAAASVVSLTVVICVRANQGDPLDPSSAASNLSAEQLARSVDQIWRWILGVALLPGLIAMVLRLNVPESPRYTMDVANDTFKAFDETNRFRHAGLQETWDSVMQVHEIRESEDASNGGPGSKDLTTADGQQLAVNQSFGDYFFGGNRKWYQRNWTILAGTALTWFALDLGFFALSINSPRTIAKIWWYVADGQNATSYTSGSVDPPWNTDFSDISNFNLAEAGKNIYAMLIRNNWQSLITNSIGASLGSAAMFFGLWRWRMNQKQWQLISFGLLTVLFVVTGVSYVQTVGTNNHTATVVLYILCQIFFYFGPNTLTFIIPAQLFPTRYRATCAGISAAAGKLGSVIIQAFLSYAKIDGQGAGVVVDSKGPSKWLGYALMVCAIPMLVGALVTHFWIPNLQKKDGEHRTLEELIEVKDRHLHEIVEEDEED